MHSIRTKFTLVTVIAIIAALSVATIIGVISIRKLGRSDADQMIHLTCATGALSLESYFDSVEHSAETVATLVNDSLSETTLDHLGEEVERSRNVFSKIANNTNGVLTYYFRIDPEISDTVKGYWYVAQNGNGFKEHEVTDIKLYDTKDTSSLVWFTVPKATGKGVWLPPYYTENLDERVISYNMPVFWKDTFVGVVGIEIDYDTLAKDVSEIKIMDSGYAFILDEDSSVIYHPQLDSVKLDLETTVLDEPEEFIGSNHIRYNYEGVEKEAVWTLLSNGMRLYVCVPVSEINSGWQGMIKNIIVAALFILIIIIVVMMQFSKRITKPLSDLTEAARQADNGNYDFELDYSGNDEVGALTHTFKELTAHTKDHITSLNKQVFVDPLTSVRNKGAYGSYIQKLQDLMDSGENIEFAFGVFDCDGLKAINDTYGHDKGDLYIKGASRLICRIFQHSPVFRIGGDEFAVIMQNEDFENREELIDKFRKTRDEISGSAKNEWEKAGVTMGIAVYDPEIDHAAIDVARRADRDMYMNKQSRKRGSSQAASENEQGETI